MLLGAVWLALVATACSGTSSPAVETSTGSADGPRATTVSQTSDVLERQYGQDADGFYLLTPRRRSWSRVVVFVHGHGGPSEITPVNHRPWLRHLAALGSAVVYPRYEEQPGGHGAARHVDVAVRSALAVLGTPSRRAPIVGIGYSRGGRLVVDWAALAAPRMKPRAILSVFPASAEEPSPDLSRLAPTTRILILVGDRDEVVGHLGAVELIDALGQSGFDMQMERSVVLESTPEFTVDHLSVLDHSPRARQLFWTPADRLIQTVS
jgi:dienelactone hydrolase